MTLQLIYLENLPNEILHNIVEYLGKREVKCLSSVNKRMRDISQPFLFRNLQFSFTQNGLNKLEGVLNSQVSHHIVSIQYVVPELLSPDILKFEEFKTRVFSPDDYLEACESWESWSDSEGLGGNFPSYLHVYTKMRQICVEQRQIIETQRDSALLSLSLQSLPRLNELSLKFCETLETEDWVEAVIWRMTLKERPYEHHIHRVSAAITTAKGRNASFDTIRLIGLALCHSGPRRVRDMHYLTTSLADLLKHTLKLQLLWSESAVESLADVALGIHRLDLCSMSMTQRFLKDFLRTNARSIRTLALHNVEVSNGSGRPSTSLHPQAIGEIIEGSFRGKGKSAYQCCQCPWQGGWKFE